MAPTTGDIYPAFCYFQKLTHSPVRVQAFAGEVYRLTCLYDNRSDLSEPCTCHLGVLPDGQLQLLKEPRTYWTQLETGRRHGHRDRFHLRQTAWAYPAWVTMEPERDRDPARWTGWLLRMALDTYLASLERIVVRAHQGGCVAAFGIDLKRGPVFFKDRDKETALARDGKRKRIFHAVRSHVRQVPGGPTTVQAHYRGLRTFLWNGRRIHIVLPELTHLLDCPVAAEPLEPEPADMRPWLTEGQLGEHVAEKLEQ
jgi:hypothetical protein